MEVGVKGDLEASGSQTASDSRARLPSWVSLRLWVWRASAVSSARVPSRPMCTSWRRPRVKWWNRARAPVCEGQPVEAGLQQHDQGRGARWGRGRARRGSLQPVGGHGRLRAERAPGIRGRTYITGDQLKPGVGAYRRAPSPPRGPVGSGSSWGRCVSGKPFTTENGGGSRNQREGVALASPIGAAAHPSPAPGTLVCRSLTPPDRGSSPPPRIASSPPRIASLRGPRLARSARVRRGRHGTGA
ncbi:unnamed protein product [Gadus morhua 'NCC']